MEANEAQSRCKLKQLLQPAPFIKNKVEIKMKNNTVGHVKSNTEVKMASLCPMMT